MRFSVMRFFVSHPLTNPAPYRLGHLFSCRQSRALLHENLEHVFDVGGPESHGESLHHAERMSNV